MIEVVRSGKLLCPGPATSLLEVRFVIPARPDVTTAALVGDFNDWSTTATTMTRTGDDFHTTVWLRPGLRYRFKYLLDGERWENDWAADDYETNERGGDDSVLDLRDPPRQHRFPLQAAVTKDSHRGNEGTREVLRTPA